MEEPFSLRPRPARALTVSELTRQIQMLLEQAFPAVWVEGEVSEVSYHTSGHLYFTLKDSHNVLKCVAWRQTRERLKFTLETGMQAVCLGRVGLYAKKASLYQLYVEQVEPKGVGALQLAFEQRMDKLKKEGLFEEERKRPLPAFPQRIGIVTSPAGAAIQDILKILKGQVGVVLRPVPVQGEGAAEAIVQGIRDLNSLDGIDLLIVGRGGGSLEDLWAFNEEVVARAIFSSRLPVISAVGHEHNVMISDLVADLRAPTPTKAAEQVLAQRRGTLDRLLTIVEEPAFAQPEEWLEELEEQMGEFEERLLAGSPQTFILQKAQRLQGLREILVSETRRSLEKWEGRVDGLGGRLNALSPLAVLERGYSITFDEKGKIVKAAAELEVGDRMETRLHQGRFTSRVESTQG
ncbi:MAG: exodeoxyribonuclease VII large subunit [Candidatus Omnitrophica bacterium]|nr:exodeoxyribonuclease VII large subunit [Candidatus Omnitrophota bacterium]